MRLPTGLLAWLLLTAPIPALAGHPLHRGVVYVLDYADNHPIDPALVPTATEHPPHIVHLPHDMVIDNTWGTAYAGKRPWVPRESEENAGCLSIAELKKVEQQLREMAAKLRGGGVEVVAPYICNQTLAGDPQRRSGIWAFYDRWDNYPGLGLGPKPAADPIRWLAREPDDKLHFNYETRIEYFRRYGQRRFAPCVNNPSYNQYLKAVVEWIARVGMNGVFVDNCILNCYCRHCTDAFRVYLKERYTPQELKRRFGSDRVEEIQLGERGNKLRFVLRDPGFRQFLQTELPARERKEFYDADDLSQAVLEEGGNGFLWSRAGEYLQYRRRRPDDPPSPTQASAERSGVGRPTHDWGIETPHQRALWAETQLFWAESVRANLAKIKQWGSAAGTPFHVIPNWGAMQTITGHEFREEIGHDVGVWAPASDWIFFEEDTNPGRIADGLYLDFVLQHKYALAAGRPAVVMTYGRQEEPFTELSMAEALAHGGGHVKIGWQHRPLHRKYRALGESVAESSAGAKTYARVALALCYREPRMRNRAHLRELYEWVRYLGAQHILYDIVLDKHLTAEGLAGYDVLIVPQAAYLSDNELVALRHFRDRGGVLVSTGELGHFDDAACPRDRPPRHELLGSAPTEPRPGVSLAKDGRFVHAVSLAELVPQEGVSRDLVWSAGRSRKAMTELEWSSDFDRYKLMALADQLAPAHRYYDGGWLGQHLQQIASVWRPLADSRSAAGLGLSAFILDKAGRRRLAVQAVNYNLPLTEKENPRFEPLQRVELRVPLPDKWQVKSVALHEPAKAPQELSFRLDRGALVVTVPRLEVLAWLDIRAE